MSPQGAPTRDEALANAARLLREAELIQDRGLMERYTEMANSWLTIASVLQDSEPA
ncbi:hypothetical protein [Streptomonospora arabica]|uniref:Uncharacterized protein n=1 Tax=Streptomonospora arabica TaxID=412417 RepID=A0ABV9SSK6_9ACTN